MRVVTFNICSGRNQQSGAVAQSELLAAVDSLEADVLALQEVDRRQARSSGLDQAAEAASAMGCEPYNWRFAAALKGTPGGEWTPASAANISAHAEVVSRPGPEYGIALLSRIPVLEWTQIRLAPAPVRSPVIILGRGGRPGLLLLRDEPRVALVAVLDTTRGPLTVVTTHLSFVPGWNVHQLRILRRRLADKPRPLVLAGDLNLPGRLPAAVTGWQPLIRAKTFPVARPHLQLDHLLTDGRVQAVQAKAITLPISDHRALMVELPD